MSPRSPILIAVLGAALLAPAAALARPPRADDPPANPVPAGQMQHTVIETTFPPATNTPPKQNFRDERWVGHDAGRETVTDLPSGKVRSDCQVTVRVSRCYWAQIAPGVGPKAGEITIYDSGLGHLLRSWLDDSIGVRSLLQQGYYHITGNTTFLGRPALTIGDNGPAPSPDGGTATASVIVDADTYFTLWREDRNIDMPWRRADGTKGTQQVDQIAETKVMELVDPAGVKLTIGSYPGAKVTDERPAAVAASALVDRDGPAQLHERRANVRGMLEGIAILPEEQRHALLRREVDGASHADIASELGITGAASRSLVSRARENLVKRNEALDARCDDVQRDLLRAYRTGRRASAHVYRHLAGCKHCRAYRGQLRAMREALHALHPGGLLLLSALASKLGLAGKGTIAGLLTKTPATIGAVAALSAAAVGGTLVIGADSRARPRSARRCCRAA